MKRITLVRHGETYQNRHQLVQGSDPTQGRLTEKGVRQAQLLGERLAGHPFDMVFCSPLERAVLTMSQILVARSGDRTLPIVFPPELREINLGFLHGHSHAEWTRAITGDPMAWVPKGGESWLDVQQRATAYLRDHILPIPHQEILVVAHGGVNRGIIASLTGITMGQAWEAPGVGAPQDNTCINLLEVDDNGGLISAVVNDTAHLDGEYLTERAAQRWIVAERRWEILGDTPQAGAALQA